MNVLLECLGCVAYHHRAQRSWRFARITFGLQALLLAAAVSVGWLEVRHPSLYSLPLEQVWRCFTQTRVACVYVVLSAVHRDEYIGSTANFAQRLSTHTRHILASPPLAGHQFMHTYVHRFRTVYVFLPVSLTGGAFLEHRLIRTFCPALNIHSLPCPASWSGRRLAHATSASRHHHRRALSPDLQLAAYTFAGVRYLQLFDALTAVAEHDGAGLIFASPGSQWLDSSKILLRCYGSCLVTCIPLAVVDVPLSSIWQPLKRFAMRGRFVFSVAHVAVMHPYLLARATLLDLLADRSHVRHLYSLPQKTLLTLMRAAQHFTPVASRFTLCSLVNAVHVARFHYSLLSPLVVRVPYGLHPLAADVTAVCKHMLQCLPLPRCFVSWLQSHLRVVCTRGRSIAQVLHTHRALALSVTRAQLVAAVDDGVVLRCSDYAHHPVLRLLDCHSGLCPMPSASFDVSALMLQLQRMFRAYQPCPAGEVAARMHVFRAYLASAARVLHQSAMLSFKLRRIPPLGWWVQLRRALLACGLICMPLDRDIHRFALCSVAHYCARLRKLFLDDTTHYAPCSQTPAAIVHGWAQVYQRQHWRRFGPFDQAGTIAYAYVFPKAKDVTRSRVIVSCVKHPLRDILHLVGRVLVHLLCRCAFQHYNLYSVAEFTQRLGAFAAQVPSGDVLFALCTDVKEMYTGMRHAETIDSVVFMLDHCRVHLRSPYVSIQRGAHGSIMVGRSRARGFVCFHLDDLLPFVVFELANLYFTVGTDFVLHQIVGAAMGGFTSPACAQCVVSVAEYRCMRMFIASSLLCGLRFMDDTFTVLNLSAVARTSAPLACIVHNSFHMYDDAGLDVELEAAGFTATLLSSRVLLLRAGVHCVFWNKNASFAATGRQRVRRLLPCILQTYAAQRGLMCGMLARVAAATLPASYRMLLPVLLQLRHELSILGYGAPLFDACVAAYVHNHRFDTQFLAWRALLQRFRHRASAAALKPP